MEEEMLTSAPQEQANAEEITEETAQDTTTEAETETAEAQQQDTIRIRYNHEDKDLTREEAVKWAQKGMQSDALMGKLRYLAARSGKSLGDTISELSAAQEKVERQKVLDEVGGNEELAEEIMAARKAKIEAAVKEQIEAEIADEQTYAKNETERRAAEYVELKGIRPELDTLDKVPDAVLRLAQEKKISLIDAYLRYEDTERRKATAAAKKAEEAASSAVGKLDNTDTDGGTAPIIDAMMKGIWGT